MESCLCVIFIPGLQGLILAPPVDKVEFIKSLLILFILIECEGPLNIFFELGQIQKKKSMAFKFKRKCQNLFYHFPTYFESEF